jgi:hypothetical protein
MRIVTVFRCSRLGDAGESRAPQWRQKTDALSLSRPQFGHVGMGQS